jgi:integrase
VPRCRDLVASATNRKFRGSALERRGGSPRLATPRALCPDWSASPSLFTTLRMRMFAEATEPLRTPLWIAGETGMRPAEVCGLDAKAIDLENRFISVWQSVSLSHIVAPKTAAGYRDFAISEELAEHIRMFLSGKREGLLFQTPEGGPWRESKVVERKLNPLLDRLGIEHFGKGLKALRHWNSTEMDRAGAPSKVRQTRLGHDDPRTTLGMRNRGGYIHIVSADDRAVAAQFGSMFGRVLRPDESSEWPVSSEGMLEAGCT